MADDFRRNIDRVSVKAHMVIDRYNEIAAERDTLRNELTEARASIIALKAENEKLRSQVDYMHMASNLAPDPEGRAKARAMIADMIADIDRCLADLAE